MIQLLGRKDGGKYVRQFGIDVYLLLYLKWTTSKVVLYIAQGTMLNVVGQSGWRGVWGRMDTSICMVESFCCPPETLTTLLIGILMYKIKSSVKKPKSLKAYQLFS